jgi:hypothetical protein
MMFILSLLFATPPLTRVEYANDSAIVVYAMQEAASQSRDFEHHVFVALVKDGREIDRDEVTSDLMTVDEVTFLTITARINRFKVADSQFFDVVIETGISGSGRILETEDFFFRVDGGRLFRAGVLKGTAGSGRGGWSFVSQTTSDLSAGQDGILLIRRYRKATGSKPDEPLIVHCRVTRTFYRLKNETFEATKDSRFRDGRRLARIARDEIVPCCAGCELRH